MSEWVDFSVYAASCIVLWILFPLATRDIAVPIMMARNAEWVAANPANVQRIARSRWFTNTSLAWGVLTIVILLLTTLGMVPPIAGKQPLLWQQLNQVYNLLFAVGFVFFGIAGVVGHHKLKQIVPAGERRTANLQPRSAADSVPLFWRVLTDVLTVALIAVWLFLGVKGVASTTKHWGGFAFLLLLALLFAVIAHASAARPPNYMDRLYGPAYRHREVRIAYAARLGIALLGAVVLASSIVGPASMPIHPVRLSLLLFQALFMSFLLAFALLKPAGTTSTPPDAPQRIAKMRTGLTTSLFMLVVVPIIATAAVSSLGQRFAQRNSIASHSLPIQPAVGRITSVGLGALATRTSE